MDSTDDTSNCGFTCPICGSTINPGDNWCTGCGHPVNELRSLLDQQPATPAAASASETEASTTPAPLVSTSDETQVLNRAAAQSASAAPAANQATPGAYQQTPTPSQQAYDAYQPTPGAYQNPATYQQTPLPNQPNPAAYQNAATYQQIPQAYQTMPVATQPTPANTGNTSGNGKGPGHGPGALILEGLALGIVVAAVLIAIVIPRMQPAQSNDQQSQQAASTDQGTSDSQDSSNSQASNTAASSTPPATSTVAQDTATQAQAAAAAQAQAAAQQDDNFHATLSSYYSELANYDKRIASAADDFNNNYTSSSMSKRSSYDYDANSLYNELVTQRNNLYQVSLPANTAYSSQYSDLKRCYDDCVKRIQVIAQAWDNSLQYSDPSAHKSAITAPIAADSNGKNNRYYTDFNNVYPSIKL